MQKIKVEIPKYLIKFLQKSYGINVRAAKNHDLGNILIKYLQKDYVKNAIQDPNNVYSFYISNVNASKYGYYISPAKNKELNKDLNSLFNIALESYVNMSESLGLEYTRQDLPNLKQSRYSALEQFLAYYDISEDELKFASLYRKDLRRREVKEKNNNQPKVTKPKVDKELEAKKQIATICKSFKIKDYHSLGLKEQLSMLSNLFSTNNNSNKPIVISRKIGRKKNTIKKSNDKPSNQASLFDDI